MVIAIESKFYPHFKCYERGLGITLLSGMLLGIQLTLYLQHTEACKCQIIA